jgi:hypothetical protein
MYRFRDSINFYVYRDCLCNYCIYRRENQDKYYNYISKYSTSNKTMCNLSKQFYDYRKHNNACADISCCMIIMDIKYYCNNCEHKYCRTCIIDVDDSFICISCYKQNIPILRVKCCNTEVSQYDKCRNCNVFVCSKHIKKGYGYKFCEECYNKEYTCIYCEQTYFILTNDGMYCVKYSKYIFNTCGCGDFICRNCNDIKSSSKCFGCYEPTCKSKPYTINCSTDNCNKSMNIPLCCNHPNKDKLIYNSKKFKYCEIDKNIFCSSCTSRCKCCNVYTKLEYIISYRNTKYSVVCYKCFMKIFKIQQWWKMMVYNPNSNYCKKIFNLYLADKRFII